MHHTTHGSHHASFGRGSVLALLSLVALSCGSDGKNTSGSSSTTSTAVSTSTTSGGTATSTSTTDSSAASVPGHNGNGPLAVGDDGSTHVQHDRMQDGLSSLPVATLSDAEKAGLLYMREEEKLARDFSRAMFTKWQNPVFENISAAEQTHFEAVGMLLQRYGLTDPAATDQPGVFQNETLRKLFDQLIKQGSTSRVDALSAGATIEEIDIVDLGTYSTPVPDIALVYSNLELASRNHLRAFVRDLAKLGVTYTPLHLSQTDFDAIIAASMEQGATS